MAKIPLSRPDIGQADIASVIDILSVANFSDAASDPIEEFEAVFAQSIQVSHAVAVNSGTSGLQISLQALGLRAGDKVATTPYSFVASTSCILNEGMIPVFVDIHPDTWNLDPDQLEAVLQRDEEIKGILAVEVFGAMSHFPRYRALADQYQKVFVEDACEAYQSSLKGRNAGTFGDCSVFGFYPNKQITTGEGGIVCTNDSIIANRLREYRGYPHSCLWQEISRMPREYHMPRHAAALGLSQIGRKQDLFDLKKKVVKWYTSQLLEIDEISLQKTSPDEIREHFVFPVCLDHSFALEHRNRLVEYMRFHGCETAVYFPSIHLLPPIRSRFLHDAQSHYPVCESLSDRTLCLPFYSSLTEDGVAYVVETLKNGLVEIRK